MRIVAVLFLSTLSLAAYADLYQWTDAGGQVHFSDVPPTGHASKVIKHTPDPAPPEASSSDARAIAQRQNAALQQMEKARQEREAAQQKADAQAQQDATNCQAARNLRQSEDRGHRFAYDSNGERHYFSDDEVAEQQAEADAAIQEYCH